MSQEEYSPDQLARLFGVPRSVVRRWLNSGRLDWHSDTATGEPRIARDRLDAFVAVNGMPSVADAEAGREAFEQDMAMLPPSVRKLFWEAFERLLDESDPHETPNA